MTSIRVAVLLGFLTSNLASQFAFADGNEVTAAAAAATDCKSGLTTTQAGSESVNPVDLLNELVNLAASGEKGPRYDEALEKYRQASGLSLEDIQEAIAMQVTLLNAEANSRRPGEGLLTEDDEKEANAAFEYSHSKGLLMQGAFMSAVKEGRADLVRGFLVISRQQNNICKANSAYQRYCKQLNLKAGWQGRNFLEEAAKVSKEIALILIAEGMTLPLSSLNKLKFGTEIGLILIEAGAREPFQNTLRMETDVLTLKLLEKGQAFSAKDFALAIQLKWVKIIEEALKLNPQLATETDEGVTPLARATTLGYEAIFNLLLKTYQVDPNQKCSDGTTALFSAVTLDDSKFFFALLDAGADIHVRTSQDWSVLHAAVLNYRAKRVHDYVRELVLAGVDFNLKYKGSSLSFQHPSYSEHKLVEKSWPTGWTLLKIISEVMDSAHRSSDIPSAIVMVKNMLSENGAKL